MTRARVNNPDLKSAISKQGKRSHKYPEAYRERKQKSIVLHAIRYLHLDVKEFFGEGTLTINQKICQPNCKLCIDVCPMNASYRHPETREVKVIEEFCLYCGACVLSCIVDNCIKVTRRRVTGEVESFSKPRDFILLQQSINAKRRLERSVTRAPLNRYKTVNNEPRWSSG